MGLGGVRDAAGLHVAVHPRLEDRAQRAEAHGDGRELPEVGHRAGVRVAGQSVRVLRLLLAEAVELPLGEAVQHEGACVDARRGMALEEDLVAAVALVLAAEEVVEAHVVEGGGGGEGGDMAADADAWALGPRDHDRGVPAGRVEDLALDLLVAREERLVLGGDGVDVIRAAHLGHGHALLAGPLDQAQHQIPGSLPAALVDGGIEGIEPLLGLFGIEVRYLTRKAANDDRVAIGSGSHAVPSLSGRPFFSVLLLGSAGSLLGVLAAALGVHTDPHRVPRERKRHLYRGVTRTFTRFPGDGPGKSQRYARPVTRSAKSFESRTLEGFRNSQSGQIAVVCVTWSRDWLSGVAATPPGSSPFRRSQRPGTCAIRPARVDYGQCFAHARGLNLYQT